MCWLIGFNSGEAICSQNIQLQVILPHVATEYEQKQSYKYEIQRKYS